MVGVISFNAPAHTHNYEQLLKGPQNTPTSELLVLVSKNKDRGAPVGLRMLHPSVVVA